MKNLIVFVLFVIFLISCTMPSYLKFTFDEPWFDNMSQACSWINRNISYKKDHCDDWKLPQATLDQGNGDCEDMALLLMGIMNYQKDYKPELLVVSMDESNTKLHAIVRCNNKYYDGTNGTTSSSCPYKVLYSYDYDTAMWTAEYIKTY